MACSEESVYAAEFTLQVSLITKVHAKAALCFVVVIEWGILDSRQNVDKIKDNKNVIIVNRKFLSGQGS